MSSQSLTPTFDRVRATRGFDYTARLITSGWFLLLAVLLARSIGPKLSWDSMAKITMIVFWLILCYLTISRPVAKAHGQGVLPRMAAFIGTYTPGVLTFVGIPTVNQTINGMATMCMVVGSLLTVYTVLHLGRSFSIFPQARGLAKTGPYRWVRHPLYLSEMIGTLGVFLHFISLTAVILLIVQIGAQISRMIYEEGLLTKALPEYAGYASSRWHVIPFVW